MVCTESPTSKQPYNRAIAALWITSSDKASTKFCKREDVPLYFLSALFRFPVNYKSGDRFWQAVLSAASSGCLFAAVCYLLTQCSESKRSTVLAVYVLLFTYSKANSGPSVCIHAILLSDATMLQILNVIFKSALQLLRLTRRVRSKTCHALRGRASAVR